MKPSAVSFEIDTADHPALALLRQARMIPVLRTSTADDALWAARLLLSAGLRVLEITYTIPQAELVIEELTEEFPEAVIGAGTVLDIRTAVGALAAGAKFIVSPVLEESLLQFGVAENVLVTPGVFTPTEIYRAHALGAMAVKLFPAQQAGGPDFLKAVLAPFPHLHLIPTGGIGSDNFIAYLEAGALAVGIGNHLLPSALVDSRNEREIIQRLESCYLKRLRQFQESTQV